MDGSGTTRLKTFTDGKTFLIEKFGLIFVK